MLVNETHLEFTNPMIADQCSQAHGSAEAGIKCHAQQKSRKNMETNCILCHGFSHLPPIRFKSI